jgi:hypothetical protein
MGVCSRCCLGLVRMPAGGGSVGDTGSLDLAKAPEWLYDLFNREGASFAAQCFGPE